MVNGEKQKRVNGARSKVESRSHPLPHNMNSREQGEKRFGGRDDKPTVNRIEGEYWKRQNEVRSTPKSEGTEQPQKKIRRDRRKKEATWKGEIIRKARSVWNKMPPPVKKGAAQAKKGYLNLKRFLQFLGLVSPEVKVAPIESRVQERHLELEPLCCLSSCLVRGGCMAVLTFELLYASILCLYVFVRMWRNGKLQFWRPIVFEVEQMIAHHIFLYLLLFVATTTVVMCLLLLRGLVCFEKRLLFLHLRFDYILFIFNFLASLLFALALSSEGLHAWNFLNILLFLNFLSQLPLQLWALSVVRSCADFFSLIQVFLTLAEK